MLLSTDDEAREWVAAQVSRETFQRLALYAEMLRRWQRMINLVSNSSLDQIWLRHIADSIQTYLLHTDVINWLDIGSGGGFPGLVIAICLESRDNSCVALIESDRRKCAFLQEVSRETSTSVLIRNGRIEQEISKLTQKPEIITARALAPLGVLMSYCEELIQQGAIALFMKGKTVNHELTTVINLDRYHVKLNPSLTDSDGCIVEIKRK